jgi:hypothetical protein
MMNLWWSDQNSKDWKLLDEEIEITKVNSNEQMDEAVATFLDDYNLSFDTP